MMAKHRPYMAAMAAAALLGVAALLAPIAQATQASTEDECQALRLTLARLEAPVSVRAVDVPLEDFFEWFAAATGLSLNVAWQNDGDLIEGLDPLAIVSVETEGAAAVSVLDRILAQATDRAFAGQEYTWQLTSYGEVQIGPKSILNRSRRVVLYDVADLILQVPDYLDAPDLDLNTALQSGQGGGGQSPFQEQGEGEPERLSDDERMDGLIEIIRTNVEFEQWQANGGDGAFVRKWKKLLLINAPDYVHRQINGYSCDLP